MLCALLKHSTSANVSSVARIEANLEWILGIVQTFGEDDFVKNLEREVDHAFLKDLKSVHLPWIMPLLESLSRGKEPAVLAAAPADQRRHISRSARLSLKELQMLAQRM